MVVIILNLCDPFKLCLPKKTQTVLLWALSLSPSPVRLELGRQRTPPLVPFGGKQLSPYLLPQPQASPISFLHMDAPGGRKGEEAGRGRMVLCGPWPLGEQSTQPTS